jgi:Cu/Ag efflux protein CusF
MPSMPLATELEQVFNEIFELKGKMMAQLHKLMLPIVIGLTVSPLLLAQDTNGTHAAAASQQDAVIALTDGVVKKIDRDAGKITLKHGEIKNLGMPPMTMVFRVKDAAMLDQVNEGEQVKFFVDKVNGAYNVLRIERAQ